jgi:chemotaxis family two-component system sensor kinase Cph1
MQPDTLVIHWHESGGPPARAPAATGFGTQIITGSIERQLGGKVEFEWASAGLRSTLSVPRVAGHGHHEPSNNDIIALSPPARAAVARRVMIVEDEALVALVLADQLADMGLSVVGPCSSLAEAVAAAAENEFDAAILDVNLGGELVYPVADLLSSRGIPFVFVTGYGQESIDRRFAHTTVLEKPVEPEFLEDVFRPGPNSIFQDQIARTA